MKTRGHSKVPSERHSCAIAWKEKCATFFLVEAYLGCGCGLGGEGGLGHGGGLDDGLTQTERHKVS